MTRWLLLLSVVGIAVAIALIVRNGAAEVGSDILRAGWGVPLVALVRITLVSGAGMAWYATTPREPPVAARTFVLLRLIREGINALLPVATIGGEVVGARLLTFYGPSGSTAAAGIIVDVFLQALTQLLFAVTGFTILLWLGGESPLIRWIGIGLVTAAGLLAAFFIVQRIGTFAMAENFLFKLVDRSRWTALAGIGDLDARLREIYRRTPAVARAFFIHLSMWFLGSLEVWLALRFMGHPVSLLQAISIEALGQAVKGAAFAVPGAYGIQEGGYIALCGVFGVPPQEALALSLIKRVPDFVIGIPALIGWQSLEGRRLLRRQQSGSC